MPYLLVFVTPLVVAIGISLGAVLGGTWGLLPVAFTFVFIPVLDHLVGLDRRNRRGPGPPAREALLRALPILFVPLHLLILAAGLATIVATDSLLGQVCLTMGIGIGSGIAINVAHELMHRPGRLEQRLAAVVMATTLYAHFCVEHVQGHHKNVGTAGDPATARRGESLYRYLPRTLLGSLRSAWAIERARVGISTGNRMLRYAVGQLGLLVLVGLAFGTVGLLAFAGQAAVAVGLLEVINYIEHYGLQRAIGPSGRPERVRPEHSWNASFRVTNWLLLNLARHSDHHAFVARPYPDLRHYEEVPQFPTGYAGMVLLALVPPLWFRVMDPRVEAVVRAGEGAGAARMEPEPA